MARNSDWGKNLDKICSLLLRLIRVEFYIILLLFCDFSVAACDTDTNAAMLSIVFLLDASASIGSSNFATMKTSAASAAVTFATTGARVGVVVFGSSASVVVPLQEWENTAQLHTDIENIGYSGGDTATAEGIETSASALGSEGMRIIILFTDGESNNWEAAENAANTAKQEGISIYAGGIGDSVNEDELNSLVSNPPEDYRVSIENFNADTFNQEVRPLIASTCLSKNNTIISLYIRSSTYNNDNSYYAFGII